MYLLRIAGIGSILVAVFQAVISFSPSWSLYFGAPEDLVANPTKLLILGLIFSIIFLVFGLYGLSGGRVIRYLPLLRSVLLIIGGIYCLRGLVLILQLVILLGIIHSDEVITLQLILSSIISFVLGMLYLIGTRSCWQHLKRN